MIKKLKPIQEMRTLSEMKIDLSITVEREYTPKRIVFIDGTEKRWHELEGQQYYLELLGLKIPISKEEALVIEFAMS